LQAFDECRGIHGNLLRVDSAEQDAQLHSDASSVGNGNGLIIAGEAIENVWKDDFGKELTYFGEHNFDQSGECLRIAPAGNWDDYRCDNAMLRCYACELGHFRWSYHEPTVWKEIEVLYENWQISFDFLLSAISSHGGNILKLKAESTDLAKVWVSSSYELVIDGFKDVVTYFDLHELKWMTIDAVF